MTTEDDLQAANAQEFQAAFEAAMVEISEVPDEEGAAYRTRYPGIAETVGFVEGIVELMPIPDSSSLDETKTPGEYIFQGYVLGLTNVIKWAEAKSMREQFPDSPASE